MLSDLERARELVGAAERIVVLTGAGMSTASGIPDFRGPNGVWTKNPDAEKLSSIDHYLSDPEVRVRAWRSRVDHPGWTARPNAAHRAVVDLERQGRLHTLVTQNIDGLHHLAGSDPAKVVEIHGTLREVVCQACGWRGPMQGTLARVRAGEEDPPCQVCGGILKSATISFGQSLVEADLDRAFAAASSADLLLTAGTTLSVYPVAGMVPIAVRAGAKVVIVNGEPTAQDDLADVIVTGDLVEVLPSLLAAGGGAEAGGEGE